jgi:hypothetical protein
VKNLQAIAESCYLQVDFAKTSALKEFIANKKRFTIEFSMDRLEVLGGA